MMIYLDNAATSWPKPPEVIKAMVAAIENSGGNPGRSGHQLSIAAGRIVFDVREKVAALFHVNDPLRVIFTSNATYALNLAMHGILKPGDRVLTGSMEHNSVMRPLREFQGHGVTVEVVPSMPDGSVDLALWSQALRKPARLVVLCHASNVVGTITPVKEIAAMAHGCGALILVDAAQTAGVIPIDMKAMDLDFLAFAGHKGTLGPGGTGGLVINDSVDYKQLDSLVYGGTGSLSDMEIQPGFLPDKFESGTLNLPGIAGLGAGIDWLNTRGIDMVRDHEKQLAGTLIEGLKNIAGVRLFSAGAEKSTAVVSFDYPEKSVSEIGSKLDDQHNVLCRVGLHCAPAAHKTLGSFPHGTVRLAPGVFTTLNDIGVALKGIEKAIRS